jgi:excisionase family DNA binding protein
MRTVLDADAGTMSTPYGRWTIAAKHTRAGGDVDVVLARRPPGALEAAHYAFRRDEGEWTQLAGAWTDIAAAIKEAARTLDRQVFTATYVIPLLNVAAGLDDFWPLEWLTVAEAADLVGASKDTIHNRIKAGLVTHRKDGRRYEVTKASVLEAFPPVGGTA